MITENKTAETATFWVRYFFFKDIYFLERTSLFNLEITATFLSFREL